MMQSEDPAMGGGGGVGDTEMVSRSAAAAAAAAAGGGAMQGNGGSGEQQSALLIPVGHNVSEDSSNTKKRTKRTGGSSSGGGGQREDGNRRSSSSRLSGSSTRRSGRKKTSTTQKTAKCIKYGALFMLVAQMVGLVLLMRYSRTQPRAPGEPLYLASTAVFFMEVMKLFICLAVIAFQEGCGRFFQELHLHLLQSPTELLKLTVPSLLYTVQNNLLYLALTNLDAATYQVCYQLKILTTALFSAILLGRRFSRQKWIALLILTAGVAFVQISGSGDQHMHNAAADQQHATGVHDVGAVVHHQVVAGATTTNAAATGDGGVVGAAAAAAAVASRRKLQEVAAAAVKAVHDNNNRFIGLVAVLCAACTSGFAGVYFEKILKGSRTSLWIRNIQMGLPSVLIAAITVYVKDGEALSKQGWTGGYNGTVWTVVTVQAVGGLIVATVVKYADNVLKVFATSFSIIISCIISAIFFDFHPSWDFVLGASLVVSATVMYSKPEPSSSRRRARKSILPMTKSRKK